VNNIFALLKYAVIYLFTKVLGGTLIICAIVAASFAFTKDFSFLLYGERIVWVGIAMNILAGVIVMGQMAAGKEWGVNSMVRSIGEAKRFMEHNLEIRAKIEKRYDVALLIWLVGLACVGAGALVDFLFV